MLYDAENKTEIIVKDTDELIRLIDNGYSKARKLNDKIKLTDILWNFGIDEREEINTMQLSDRRTEQIIELYLFFRNSPERAFDPIPKIWFDSVIMLNNIFQVRLF